MENNIKECFSPQLDRGVLLVRPSGQIAFPHELCETADQLTSLALRLPGDPLILKAYTERALSQLIVRWRNLKDKPKSWTEPPTPEVKFKDLSSLRPESIREYTMELLKSIADSGDDAFVKAFCTPDGDNDEEKSFPAYEMQELLFSNAYAFPGVTLVADDDPKGVLREMAKKLLDQMPKDALLDLDNQMASVDADDEKAKKLAQKAEDAGEEAAGFFSGSDTQAIKYDSSLVIQSEAFLKKYCPKYDKDKMKLFTARNNPTIAEFRAINKLPVSEEWKMLALAGAGAYDPTLDTDKYKTDYTQWVHDKMQANKLACVTAGKEFTWGANLPASTVVVTHSFAASTSVAGMLQYVGRAARRGLTTHGQALFESDEDLNR